MRVTAAPCAWQGGRQLAEKKAMGRPTLYKKNGPDVHGRISAAAGKRFEARRKELGRVNNIARVGDGDVIEDLIRHGDPA